MTAASFGDIQSLGILQFFETDPRPTFLFDITINSLESIPIEYSNPILQNNSLLSRQLKTGVDCGGNWPSFKAWVTDTIEDDDPLHDPQPTFTFVGNVWSRNTLLNRWRVISANAAESRPHKRQRKRQISSSPSSRQIPTFGKQGPGTYPSVPRDVVARPIIEEGQSWSLPPKGEDPTKYIEFFRSVDWSVTALGPMENWPRRLHEMADLVLRDSRPCALYWGPDYTIIYNSAYAGLTGSKHPGLMGKTCADAWPEASSALIGTMERARISGVASLDDEWQLFLDRLECGKLEETYFSWSLVPIYDGDECPGFLGPVFETTKHRIAQRRIWLINKLGEYMAEATSVRSFWEKTFQGLMVADSTDLPLVLLYSVADEGDSSTGSGESRIFCLEGALGIPDGGHQLAPVRLDLFRDQAGLAPYFKSAIRLGRPLLIAIADIEPSSLESLQWRGFGDACTHAVICPIRPTKDENVMGLLMIGLNPRRPYDFEYNEFISILSQKLATTLASSVLFEEEVRRGRNAAQQAAFDQAKLFELLAIRTKEADESTRRFQIFSEAVPTGLCFSRPDGTISYANDVWYKLTSFVKGKDVITIDNISNCVFDDDRSFAMDQQRKVLSTGETISYELRLKDLSTGSPDVSKWILCTSSAERDSKGSIEAVITCLTDITASKKATEEANFRAQQAERLSEKLSRFRRMAETSTVGLFDLDFDGNILEANDAFYTVMNMRKDGSNITPQATWVDAILEEDVSKAIQNLDDLTVQGKAVSAELRVRHAAPDDGVAETRNIQSWVLCTAMPLRNSEGEMVGFTGCVTDITSQKFRAQNTDERAALLDQLLARTEEAKSSEEKFTHFAQAAPIGIAINDPDGNINFCNETWYQITSYPRDLPLNGPVSWVVLVLDEDLPIIVNAWETLSAKKEAISIEFRLKNPWIVPGRSADKGSKAERWISCSSVPEIDDAGAVKSVMSCMSDISHFKWAESIEKQRAVEALESKRQQENFIDMTSHEMRNPLSAIVQCADVVVGSLVGLKTSPEISPAIEASIDAAQTIVSCAQHQKRIVDDILTLSKLDSDLLTITLIQLDPKKILRDSLKMFEAEASRADIKLSPIIDSSVDELKVEYVLLDPSRLLQVLINLLTNALKFTTNGEIKVVTVTMKAFRERPSTIETHIAYVPARGTRPEVVKSQKPTPDDLYLHFSVCDTGRGLTEGEKKMLFKRFSQVSPRTHVQYGGSGLGLFISRELTELQGGEIGVASEAGVGSTFAFYVKAQRTTAPKESSPFSSSYNAAQFSPSDIVSQLSVLVVEDNLINQAVLSKQLRRLGCTVHLANHGQEALAFLEETNFWRGQEEKGKDLSVVLLDIEMPVMDGLTCVKRVRDLQSRGLIRGHIPIIAVSANARSEQIMTAMEAGMDDVVVKPFRIPDLMPKIMELVQRLRSNGHHVRPSVR